MGRISHTNIIVDEFSMARCNPFNKYVHFLTHIHVDHLKGLSNSWDYGPIYCSAVTKHLILLKYPKLSCLRQLQLDKQHVLPLSSELQVTVTMFNANHCPGGVMILFEGFMGNVLYTGDFRFDKNLFSQYSYLYPPIKRNKDFKGCSIQIDFLYLDTTFLHPKFNFPPQTEALSQLEQLIEQTIEKANQKSEFIEFYIGIDTFGKEEVFIHLAQKFHTLITVTENRYKNISAAGLPSQYFTTDLEAGFIHSVLKGQIKQHVKNKKNSIGIILTGWANNAHERSERIHAIPYSLHSSYPELVAFVESLRPSFIYSILDTKASSKSDKEPSNSMNLYEKFNAIDQLERLRIDYSSEPSDDIIFLMTNTEFQDKIKNKLKLDRTSIEINRDQFGMNTTIAKVDNLDKAGAKFTTQRNQAEINSLKEKLKNKKESVKIGLFNGSNQRKIPKRIQYNGLTSLQKNQSKQNQNVVQIDDSSEQFPHNQQKQQKFSNQNQSSSREFSRKDIVNRSQKQQREQNSRRKEIEEEDTETKRKNKWKKKVESGEIDLFGPAITPIEKVSPSDKISCTLDKNSKSKNLPKKKSIIEILDELYLESQEQNNSNNQLVKKTKEKRVSNENKEKRVFNITNDNISIDEPVERSPNQRTITEYFKKSESKQDEKSKSEEEKGSITERNENKIDIKQLKSIEKKMRKPPLKEQQKPEYKQKPEQKSRPEQKYNYKPMKLIPLIHCSEINLYQISLQKLNSIKEAPIEAYQSFFCSNQ